MSDPYVYPDTSILKNKLGITIKDKLDQAERYAATSRLYELYQKPISGKFDLAHLQKIHKHIFQDIYEWAGKIRTVDIAKSTLFCHIQYLDSYQRDLFQALQKEKCLQGLDIDQFSNRAAYYLGEINMLHPFREGNGRTQREFMRELALVAGWELNLDVVPKEMMLRASIQSANVSNNEFEKLIRENIKPIEIHIDKKSTPLEKEYKHLLSTIPQVTPIIDQQFAKTFLSQKHPEKDIATVIAAFSPNALGRSNEIRNYASTIIKAAQKELKALHKKSHDLQR